MTEQAAIVKLCFVTFLKLVRIQTSQRLNLRLAIVKLHFVTIHILLFILENDKNTKTAIFKMLFESLRNAFALSNMQRKKDSHRQTGVRNF